MTFNAETYVSNFPKGLKWLDSDLRQTAKPNSDKSHISRYLPFIFIHGGSLLAFYTGASWFAIGFAILMYWARMFFVTAFYHRYFSHRSFKTNRFWQTIFAICGMTCLQRGPLWWAAHHRDHHRFSDTEQDTHSPVTDSFWHAHLAWVTIPNNLRTKHEKIQDFGKFPELVWLNRLDWAVPLALFFGIYALGETLAIYAPQLGTNGLQLIAWGFFVSTMVLFHCVFVINSLSHQFGSQRYETGDQSRNNLLFAIITMGEGWHNNHHYYPSSVRQGHRWWEIDATFYILKVMSWLGIIYDLKPVPKQVLDNSHKIIRLRPEAA